MEDDVKAAFKMLALSLPARSLNRFIELCKDSFHPDLRCMSTDLRKQTPKPKRHHWGYKIVMDVCSPCADKRMVVFDSTHLDITNEFGVKEEWIRPRHAAVWGKQFEEPVIMFGCGRDVIYLCAICLAQALESVKKGEIDE